MKTGAETETPKVGDNRIDDFFQEEDKKPAKSPLRRYAFYAGVVVLAILLIVGLRYFLMGLLFPTTASGESVANLAYLYNQVVSRSSKDPAFQKAKLDQKLFENDAIRTFPNSHAEVKFLGGDEIRMDENTLIIIRGVKQSKTGKGSQYYLYVENGSVVLKLQAGQENLHFIETAENKILFNGKDWQGDAEIGIQLQTDGKTKVTTYAGSGSLEIDGKQVQLGQNEYVLSSKEFVAEKRFLPASNIAMEQGEQPIIFGQEIGQDVTINWLEAPNTKSYGIEIARDAEFTKPVARVSTPREFYTYRVIGEGNYFWRVKSIDPAGMNIANGQFSFVFDDPHAYERIIVDPQKNVVEEKDESTTIFFQSDYPLVTFNWEPYKRAWGYRLEVFQDPEFEQLVTAQTVQATNFSIKPGTFRDAKYYWQVIAVNQTGEPLHVSAVHELNLVFDNAIPFLTILKPDQNMMLSEPTAPVAGVIPPGYELFINGQPFPVDARGKFKGEVPVPVGSSHVTFRAVGAEGRIEYHARSITVTSGAKPPETAPAPAQ